MLTPLRLSLISHTHTHTRQTQVIVKGHAAFPTFPMVPGILASVSEDLPDPLRTTHTHTHLQLPTTTHEQPLTKLQPRADASLRAVTQQSHVTQFDLFSPTTLPLIHSNYLEATQDSHHSFCTVSQHFIVCSVLFSNSPGWRIMCVLSF